VRKIFKYPVVFLVLAYTLYVILHYVFGGNSGPEPAVVTSSTTEILSSPSQPGRFAGRDVDRLWSTFDWSNTAPGQLLGQFVPVDLVNWIMWPVALYLAFVIARSIYRTFTGRSGDGGGSVIVGVALIVAALVAYSIFSGPKGVDSISGGEDAYVDLRSKPADTTTLRINQVVRLHLNQPRVGMMGIGCPSIEGMPLIADAMKIKGGPILVKTSRGLSYSPTYELGEELEKLLLANRLSAVTLLLQKSEVDPMKFREACPTVDQGE